MASVVQLFTKRPDRTDTRPHATLSLEGGSYATTNVDASASYKLTPHLKLTFDALNLTNQAADQWSGKVRRAQRVFSVTGRQFFLGASYTF